jgi:hypothetical protein
MSDEAILEGAWALQEELEQLEQDPMIPTDGRPFIRALLESVAELIDSLEDPPENCQERMDEGLARARALRDRIVEMARNRES